MAGAEWPSTSAACFRVLAAPIVFNTVLAIFTTPDFSELVVWRMAPFVLAVINSVPDIPALQAMSPLQVTILCLSTFVAVVIHQFAHAWRRKQLYAPVDDDDAADDDMIASLFELDDPELVEQIFAVLEEQVTDLIERETEIPCPLDEGKSV